MAALLAEIAGTPCPAPTLWWLGHSGFVLKYQAAILYVNPFLRDAQPEPAWIGLPSFGGHEVAHAGLVLCTDTGSDHLVPGTVPNILEASRRAKLVIPKSAAAAAHALGIPYHRMVTTDAGLRVEYLNDRIYAVPGSLEWTPLGGYPRLGFLVRVGKTTIFHAGAAVPYEGIADRLRPYDVTVALLPVTSFPAAAAVTLGARWICPMRYGLLPGAEGPDGFVQHLLGHHPGQRFKVFSPGEKWTVPVNPDGWPA